MQNSRFGYVPVLLAIGQLCAIQPASSSENQEIEQFASRTVVDEVTGERHDVFDDEEIVMPCDEADEREECVAQSQAVQTRGARVLPQIPFKIVSERFGRCLRPTSKAAGAEVKLYSCGNYSSRYWIPSNVTDVVAWTQLRNSWSGKCLKRDGDKLVQGSCVGGYVTSEAIRQARRLNQFWVFSPDRFNPLVGERIEDRSGSPRCIRAASSSVIQMRQPCGDSSYYRWRRNPL